MGSTVLMNFRIDEETKRDFSDLVKDKGYTMSEVLEASMRLMAEQRNIPEEIERLLSPRRSVLSLLKIQDVLRRVLSEEQYGKGIESVSVFGSYARERATFESDVDLYIKGQDIGLFQVSALYIRLERELGKKVDIVTEGSIDTAMRETVERNSIKLYEKPGLERRPSHEDALQRDS